MTRVKCSSFMPTPVVGIVCLSLSHTHTLRLNSKLLYLGGFESFVYGMRGWHMHVYILVGTITSQTFHRLVSQWGQM